jgi:N,N'-diacetyllegionaminate synthase
MNTLIIAEAGVNHNGSINYAKQLIDIATDSGADYVKFQTFDTGENITQNASKAYYQLSNSDNKESQFEMLKKLELDKNTHFDLKNYCNESGIQFLSTAFGISSLALLNELEIPLIKIASGEITNLPFLQIVGKMRKPIILSTGMATLKEVDSALNILEKSGTKRTLVTVLHCNTEYPTPMSDVNLNAMLTIREKLGVKVGYSDHTLGIEIPIAAVALGATVIEKHYTLDRNLPGPDHKASLEPNELKAMVKAIRNVENAIGNGIKQPSNSEIKNIAIARKSIVAKKRIKKGEPFSENNLAVKRPGTGISPMEWDDYMSKSSDREYQKDELIQ